LLDVGTAAITRPRDRLKTIACVETDHASNHQEIRHSRWSTGDHSLALDLERRHLVGRRTGDCVLSELQGGPADRILDWHEAIIALGLGTTGAWLILLGCGLYELMRHAI
jgi:hypothetical protein